jgi:hypothetical protein
VRLHAAVGALDVRSKLTHFLLTYIMAWTTQNCYCFQFSWNFSSSDQTVYRLSAYRLIGLECRYRTD